MARSWRGLAILAAAPDEKGGEPTIPAPTYGAAVEDRPSYWCIPAFSISSLPTYTWVAVALPSLSFMNSSLTISPTLGWPWTMVLSFVMKAHSLPDSSFTLNDLVASSHELMVPFAHVP